MKPYMLWSNYDGCGYVRQFLPMKYNGWTGDYLELGVIREQREKAREMIEADIIVAHRLDDPARIQLAKMLQSKGKKLVVDNDDTTIIEEMNSLKGYMPYRDTINNSIKMADLVTCSTPFLKKEYEKLTDKTVIVLPNCIDPEDYPKVTHKDNLKLRIGFIGSVLYKEDRSVIQDLIIELSHRNDVQIVIYGLIAPEIRTLEKNKKYYEIMKQDCDFWDTIDCEWQSNTPINTYLDVVNRLNLDIAVIARKDNYFNRCKSNIKYLEMAMLEIPCVCQSFRDCKSPYDEDIIDGWNGYLAEDQDEFKNRIEELIRFPDLRKNISKNAKQYVLDNYNIKNKAHLWAEAYQLI